MFITAGDEHEYANGLPRPPDWLFPERSPVGHDLNEPVGFDPAERGDDRAARYRILGGELGDCGEALAGCPLVGRDPSTDRRFDALARQL